MRVSALVANAFNQLREVAGRCDKTDNEEGLVSENIKPPTKATSKKKVPGKKDKSAGGKKSTGSKDRQAQMVRGFQLMIQGFGQMEPEGGDEETGRATVEGMVEVGWEARTKRRIH